MIPNRIGPYRLRAQVGSGGMGAVYRAWDERLGRTVAVKRVHSDASTFREARKRLLREARTVARLNHPAIVRVHDLRTLGDECWLVMELIEGQSLAQTLREGPLTLHRVVTLGREIAEGLDHAHQAGTIHRDLKPDNVMVTYEGHAKLLDFGIAKPLVENPVETALTKPGTLVGTCRSMSPEQAMGLPLDPRSDLFSLGTLLYEMASGDHPFAGSNAAESLTRVCIHKPPPVDRWTPSLPTAFVELIHGLLEKEPEQRPETAAIVAETLRTIEAIVPEEAPPPRPRSRPDDATLSAIADEPTAGADSTDSDPYATRVPRPGEV